LKSKENKFILDCINERSSRLKIYHPLYDNHLNFFFSSEMNRKQLKEKGFINTNGFIMYDGTYRDVMGSSPKRKNEFNSQNVLKNYGAYKSNSHRDDSTEKLVDSFTKLKIMNSPTDKKLPKLAKFEYFFQNNLITTKGKKKLKPIKIKNSKLNNNLDVDSSMNVKENEGKNSKKGANELKTEITIEEKKKSNLDLYVPKDKFEKIQDDEIIEDDL
jgi:hypothetical protein